MPKWDKFLEEEETPLFEKFDKSVAIRRRYIKGGDEIVVVKKQKERKRDEERASKRGDEV